MMQKKLHIGRHREPMNLAKSSPTPPGRRRLSSLFFRPGILVISVLLVAILGTFLWTAYQPTMTGIAGEDAPGLLTQIGHLITSGDRQLRGENDDRVNILLMGIGGEGHDGALLADTIMIVSLQPSTKKVAMLSVPRDLAVPILDYGYRKINNALAFGEQEDYPGGGERLLVDVVQEVLGINIQYYARVDFEGFVDVIDLIGGVTIDVERSFTDYQYPTEDYGFQTIRFSAGTQLMDGDTALQFVRSRHGNNGEGSDFARAARQQKVLRAAKDKILTFGTLVNPKRISGLISAVQDHYTSNLELWEISRFGEIAKEYDTEHIINYVFDNSAEGLLKTQIGEGGAYLLVPKANDFTDMQFLANNIFSASAIQSEGALVLVQNGTNEAGLAKAATEELTPFGIRARLIVERAPANGETVLYDFSNGAVPASIAKIVERFNARVTQATAEQRAAYDDPEDQPDLLLILGQDQVSPQQITYR